MRTWRYIESKDDFHRALKFLHKYVGQKYKDEWGVVQYARLALDTETYFLSEKRYSSVPRAVWDGKEWEGAIRLLQLGTDPVSDHFDYGGRQFLIDVRALGEEYVSAGAKDLIDSTICISHKAAYDWMFLDAHLDIQMKCVDLRLLGQILKAGKKMRHGLADYYREYIPGGLFFDLTGMTFAEYQAFKKKNQSEDWGVPELSKTQLIYAADDVRLIWYAYHAVTEQLDDWIERREKKIDVGIQNIINLEHKILPVFAQMEQRGLRFNREHHKQVVTPLLEQKAEEAKAEFKRFRHFIKQRAAGEFDWLFVATGNAPYNLKQISKDIKSQIVQTGWVKEGRIKKLSVTTKQHAAGDRINVRWTGDPDDEDEVRALVETWTAGPFAEVDNSLITVNHAETLKKAIIKTTGIKIYTTKAKILKRHYDPENPKTEVIKYVLRYNKARTYASKYGRGMLQWVNARGYLHPTWNQIGSDHSEITSGRSSCSEPALMQMPSRDMLFQYDGQKGIPSKELLRSLIVAAPGCMMIDADYSKIEPAMIAQLSGDRKLRSTFTDGIDLYNMIAEEVIFGEPMPEDKESFEYGQKREIAKVAQLSKFYRAGPTTMADNIYDKTDGDVFWSKDQAKEVNRDMDAFFPDVTRLALNTQHRLTRRLDEVGSLAPFRGGKLISHIYACDGRQRGFYIDRKDEKLSDEELEKDYAPEGERYYYNAFKKRVGSISRVGFNFLIQGSCAGMLKWAEYYVHYGLEKAFANHPRWNSRIHGLLLVLHDELLIQVPDDKESVELGKRIMKAGMLKAARKYIDFFEVKIGMKHGRNWYDASPK